MLLEDLEFFGQEFVCGVSGSGGGLLVFLFARGVAGQLFDGADGEPLRDDLFVECELHLRVFDGEEGAGVPHVDAFVLQPHLYFGRQLEQAQVVCHGGALLPVAFAQLFLREPVGVDEVLVGEGRFAGVPARRCSRLAWF